MDHLDPDRIWNPGDGGLRGRVAVEMAASVVLIRRSNSPARSASASAGRGLRSVLAYPSASSHTTPQDLLYTRVTIFDFAVRTSWGVNRQRCTVQLAGSVRDERTGVRQASDGELRPDNAPCWGLLTLKMV